MDILTVFCDIDDFCLLFEPHWRKRLSADVPGQRQRATRLWLSEVMTIIVLFHWSGYRNLQDLLHAARLEAHGRGIPTTGLRQPRC